MLSKQTTSSKALFPILLTLSVLFSGLAFSAASAADPIKGTITTLDPIMNTAKKLLVDCRVDRQGAAQWSGEVVSVNAPLQVQVGELFDVKIQIRNTSNTPWFSSTSGCQGISHTFLGSTRNTDRISILHAPAIFGDTKWYAANRIIMKTPKVLPGEIAEFTFKGHAPSEEGIYREYFAPVVESTAWIEGKAEVTFDVRVGNPQDTANALKYTQSMPMSINLLDPKFEGEKKIVIDISAQKMSVRIGEMEIKNFPVSTGTSRTPTPFGTTKILLKQEVRVGAARPHYIMPKFMMFRKGGYGIHALPSLANDRGIFWREALNHIGTRRSHGCVRLLPEDANFMFDFTDIGTTVQVVP